MTSSGATCQMLGSGATSGGRETLEDQRWRRLLSDGRRAGRRREGKRGSPPSQPGGQKAGEKEKSVGVRRVHPSGGKSGEGRAGNPAGPTLPVFFSPPRPHSSHAFHPPSPPLRWGGRGSGVVGGAALALVSADKEAQRGAGGGLAATYSSRRENVNVRRSCRQGGARQSASSAAGG